MTRKNRRPPRPHMVRGHSRKGSPVNAYGRGSGTVQSKTKSPSKVNGKPPSESLKDHIIREFSLWSNNDYQLYRHKIALAMNYFRRKRKGTFNKQRALEGVANLHVPRIVKTIRKDTGNNYIDNYYLGRMSKADKMKVAKEILPSIMEQVEWYEKHPEDYTKDKGKY